MIRWIPLDPYKDECPPEPVKKPWWRKLLPFLCICLRPENWAVPLLCILALTR